MTCQSNVDVLQAITHTKPSLFRPPGGDYNTKVGQIANDLDYTIILWTDDPGDYADPGEKAIFNRIMARKTAVETCRNPANQSSLPVHADLLRRGFGFILILGGCAEVLCRILGRSGVDVDAGPHLEARLNRKSRQDLQMPMEDVFFLGLEGRSVQGIVVRRIVQHSANATQRILKHAYSIRSNRSAAQIRAR